MKLTEIAQKYLDGEIMRKRAVESKDNELWKVGNRIMYEAVTEFQQTIKESQEILFSEVERLSKIDSEKLDREV